MSKKKRPRKQTVYICYEGDREGHFLRFLDELYQPSKNNISFESKHSSGGSPDRIVKFTLGNCHRNLSMAWFDEDFDPHQKLSRELREKLMVAWSVSADKKTAFMDCEMVNLCRVFNEKGRNPILVVSSPVCVESLILKVLGIASPIAAYLPDERDRQINILKGRLTQLLGGEDEFEFYRNNITKEMLEGVAANCQSFKYILSLFRNL